MILLRQALTQAGNHHRLRVPSSLLNLRQVPRWIRDTVVLSIAARAVTYAAVFMEWGWTTKAAKVIDWFWCPWYSNPMAMKWWIKYFSNDIELLLITYVVCKISAHVSNYLFLVAVIFFGYEIIDTILFLWNFKRYDVFYTDLFWTALTLIWSVFKGYTPETIAKIKSLF